MNVRKEPPRLRTAGVMADELGISLSRVVYVLRTRNIQPTAWAGTLRLFDCGAVEQVRAELTAIAKRKEARHA